MDWYTKSAFWICWIRGNDEEVLTDKECSNLKDEDLCEEDEIAEIFKIETDIFDFETTLCKAFNEFNYLLKADTDLLTKDIPGFMTYEEYKDAWIYESNKDMPLVPEEPWLENGVPHEVIGHICDPFHFKSGHVEWPTCSSRNDGYCNGRDLPGIIQIGNIVYFQQYKWYDGLEDDKLRDHWWGVKDDEESTDDAWSHYSPRDEWEDYEHKTYIQADINFNYNTYLDVCRIFNDHARGYYSR
ncbi:hypothetical protein Tco_1116003 [Tanacetum coccineum]